MKYEDIIKRLKEIVTKANDLRSSMEYWHEIYTIMYGDYENSIIGDSDYMLKDIDYKKLCEAYDFSLQSVQGNIQEDIQWEIIDLINDIKDNN